MSAYSLECHWSKDNTTWKNVTHLNNVTKEATQVGLQTNTIQYFRCKNATADYGYKSVKTGKVSGLLEDENMATLILFFAVLAAIFLLVLGIWTEDHWIANLSGILFFLIGVYIAINGFGDLTNLLSRGIAAILWAVGTYILLKVNIENM